MSSVFRRVSAVTTVLVTAVALTATVAAGANAQATKANWAARQIKAVTRAGVLGSSPATFRAGEPLTESALEAAIAATAKLQTAPPPPPVAPPPPPIEIDSSIADGAVVGGIVDWEIDVPGQSVAQVAFAVDGTGLATAAQAPFLFAEGTTGLDTTKLADGPHTLAVKATFTGGGSAIAVWQFTVDNAPSAALTGPTAPTAVPVVKQSLPDTAPATITPATPPAPARRLYRAAVPTQAVTIKQLDAALVGYLALGGAAREIQEKLRDAGLNPPESSGTEVVARLLDLRLNHPASQDNLELLPDQAATRAEAAWSFAQTLGIQGDEIAQVQEDADSLTIPALTPWQRRVLTTAVHYVGYPYVWGGTSPTAEVDFGVPAAGGFDCSGFVWRTYKLTSYPGEGSLADTLRGRTTYVMSGEVPSSERIGAAHLQPADVMFFGAEGPESTPDQVDHTALYMGGGWLIESSDEGVTLAPFDGWYTGNFAWARRPLREAGLE
jgi:cell wall-associated NlpC family hydrolase